MDWIWIWVAVIAISLIVEFITMDMVSIWTAFGGIVALILSAVDANIEFQLIAFFAVSIVLLLSLRKVSLKYLIKSTNEKIGTDSLIGSSHKLLTPITQESRGSIKINGITHVFCRHFAKQASIDQMCSHVTCQGTTVVVIVVHAKIPTVNSRSYKRVKLSLPVKQIHRVIR